MSLEMVARQRLEQRMHLSQQMLQNLELLLLPAMDLRDFVMNELQENPALEEGQDADDDASATPDEEETPEEAARREMLESVEDQWLESERRTRRSESAEDAERRMEMLNNCSASAASLKDYLSDQMLLLELPEDVRLFSTHVIEHLDDSGLLKATVEDMVTSLPKEILEGPLDVLARRVENAIAVVQSLEPRGVGARSVQECLLLQLDPADALYPVLRRFIEKHLADAAANRLPQIVRSILADPVMLKDLGREGEPDAAGVLADVKDLLAESSKLNPSPGARYSTEKARRVYPEVIIRRVDGALEIVLDDGWLPAISISRNYEDMLRERTLSTPERALARAISENERLSRDDRHLLARLASGRRVLAPDRARCGLICREESLSPQKAQFLTHLAKDEGCSRDDKEFIKRKVDAGRKLIAAIEQRRGTIYRITEQILRHQSAFFEEGIEHLRPLRMQEIADALGIHLSTVSRAVSEKWMETPQGVLPFRFFFASAAPSGETSSPEGGTRLALLEKVRDIVESEDRTNPRSDLEIARILNQTYRIAAARRTVAKYREELRFPPAKLRRCY